MNKKVVYTAAAAVLMVLLFIYIYFAFYRTAVTSVQTAKQQLQAEQDLVAVLEQQTSIQTGEEPVLATGALQTKVPVKPMSEKLLLDFEKAELLSESLVKTITFTEGEEEILPEETEQKELVVEVEGEGANAPQEDTASDRETASESDQAQEPAAENATDANEEAIEPEEQPIPEEKLPEGIRKIRAELTVESPGYEEMEVFIQTLENQLRMLRIEKLTLTGPEEAQKIEGDSQPLAFSLTVAAYYMPELTDLLEDSPELDTPDPANKQNPFVVVEQ